MVLSIIAFLLSVTYVLPLIAGALALLIVLLTLCLRLPRSVFFMALFCSVLAAVGNFVSAARNEERAVRVFASVAGILWLMDAVLFYKIPVDPKDGNHNHSNSSNEGGMDLPTTNAGV